MTSLRDKILEFTKVQHNGVTHAQIVKAILSRGPPLKGEESQTSQDIFNAVKALICEGCLCKDEETRHITTATPPTPPTPDTPPTVAGATPSTPSTPNTPNTVEGHAPSIPNKPNKPNKPTC